MSQWIRENTSDEHRVSFIVKRDKDTEIFDWLQQIPYGKATSSIKAALLESLRQPGRASDPRAVPPSVAARAPSLNDSAPPPASALPRPPPPPLTPPLTPPPAVLAPRPVNETGWDDSKEEMAEIDPETMAAMQRLADQFS